MSIAVRLFEELAVAGLAFSLLSALPASASGQSYTLVDLTAATEESHGMARDVNSERVVVGVSGFFCAARWDRIGGEWVHQELIPDFCSGPFTAPLAFAINNSSTVVGSLFQQNSWFFPLIVDQGQYETFPQLAGIFWDINNAAQAVGSNNPGGSGFIWEDGKLTSLGQNASARGINDAGKVVGSVGGEAAVWERIDGQWEVTELLGTLGGSSSRGFEINDSGQIVGSADVAGDLQHAFLWEKGVMIDLGTLGGSESRATEINNLGQVVGWAMTAEEEQHAFIWQDGVLTDLNDLIVSETSLVLDSPLGINDLGDIVGYALSPAGFFTAFIASPLVAGDVDYDSFVGARDLAQLLASWGPCPDDGDCPADFDGDGEVGPHDLVTLLGNWG